jgi:hypothetical protein
LSVAESGFVVLVPEAEALVGALRYRYDESARQGVPAHITVLLPFMEPSTISARVVQECARALGEHRAFGFQLRSVGRFPATSYLEPEPAAPFVGLTRSLSRAYPAFPPFRGEFASVIPHLTVAHGHCAEAESASTELANALALSEPVVSICDSVVLLENSSGQWKPMHVFPLAPSPGTS